MTFVVTEHCTKCKYTDCVEVCPVEAFHEGPEILYINPDTCIDCNACVPVCPVEAIYADGQVPERYKSWTQVNADECKTHPIIDRKKPPLPGALTLDEWKAKDAGKG